MHLPNVVVFGVVASCVVAAACPAPPFVGVLSVVAAVCAPPLVGGVVLGGSPLELPGPRGFGLGNVNGTFNGMDGLGSVTSVFDFWVLRGRFRGRSPLDVAPSLRRRFATLKVFVGKSAFRGIVCEIVVQETLKAITIFVGQRR